MEITAKAPFVESALWVDGTMLERAGRRQPDQRHDLRRPGHGARAGTHVAVGYARTATPRGRGRLDVRGLLGPSGPWGQPRKG